MGGSPAGPPWRCSGAQHRQPRHRDSVLCGLCFVARVGLRERSVEAGSPRRRHRAAPSRRSLLAMARVSRFRVGIPSRPSPLRQVGSWPVCPLPSCCWSRPVCSRFAAFSAACTFRVTLLPVPSLAPLRVRLLLFLRRCSKGLTWGLQPEGACALRKLMP